MQDAVRLDRLRWTYRMLVSDRVRQQVPGGTCEVDVTMARRVARTIEVKVNGDILGRRRPDVFHREFPERPIDALLSLLPAWAQRGPLRPRLRVVHVSATEVFPELIAYPGRRHAWLEVSEGPKE